MPNLRLKSETQCFAIRNCRMAQLRGEIGEARRIVLLWVCGLRLDGEILDNEESEKWLGRLELT